MTNLIIHINNFFNEHFFFYRYLVDYFFDIFALVVVIGWIMILKRYNLSDKVSAWLGFVLLGITMICNLLSFDLAAGIFSQYVLIFFVFAFIQQFSHFLTKENASAFKIKKSVKSKKR